jgi:hypothetical protein
VRFLVLTGGQRSPGRESGSRRKKGHVRTKSGGRKNSDLLGSTSASPTLSTSAAVAAATAAAVAGSPSTKVLKQHRRSGSAVAPSESPDLLSPPSILSKDTATLPLASSSGAVASSKMRGSVRSSASGASSPIVGRQARSKSIAKRPLSNSGLNKSKSLRNEEMPSGSPVLSADMLQMLEREQAIKDLEAFDLSASGKFEDDNNSGASEAVDDHVISSAAQFLRELDLGSLRGSGGGRNSDDEYAESDEAEWNNLSEEEDVVSPKLAGVVDPRLVLAELELFRVGEGPEVEEEDVVLMSTDAGTGLRDKFDMGTARGSSTSRKLK